MHFFFIFVGAIALSYVMSIPVGPVGVLCIRKTLERGRLAGFLVGIGASLSDAFYAGVIAFHIDSIAHFLEHYRFFIQIIGIALLAVIGIRSLFFSKKQMQKLPSLDTTLSDFFKAFLVNITNPSIILSFGALLVIFHLDRFLINQLSSWLFVFGVFLGSVFWWATVSSIASFIQKRIQKDIVLLIHKFSGVLILIFAFLLFLFTIWHGILS